jgi:hypothetical protein
MQYKFVYQKIKNEKNIYVLSALLDVVDGQWILWSRRLNSSWTHISQWEPFKRIQANHHWRYAIKVILQHSCQPS